MSKSEAKGAMYYLIKSLSWFFCHLPQTLRSWIAFLLGRLSWLAVSGKRRRMAANNIMAAGIAATPKAAMNMVKAGVFRFGPMLMEVLCFPLLTRKTIEEVIEFSGLQHLEQALQEGRGAVLATAHSGNWELLGAALALRGFPLVAVVQQQNNIGADRFINENRVSAGMHVTYKSHPREMVRLLSEGKIIGLLMDQNAGSDGVSIDFFGRKASTPQGPAALARLRDCPIVPAFITGLSGGRHRILLHPPVRVEKTEDRDADIRATMSVLNQIVEEHIRQYPVEWFWLHNRWKEAPTHGEK